jgi:hypothetical protein
MLLYYGGARLYRITSEKKAVKLAAKRPLLLRWFGGTRRGNPCALSQFVNGKSGTVRISGGEVEMENFGVSRSVLILQSSAWTTHM